MNSKIDLQNAKDRLASNAFTCVLCRGEQTFTATERGVKPLLNWLDSGVNVAGFSAADRVVGRGAAFLYVLLGVKAVYAGVMSRPAAEVLEANGIEACWDTLTDGIINRKGTGPCPFEEAVMDITRPEEALAAIRRKMAAMEKGN